MPGPGDHIFPGTARVGGGTGPWLGAGDISWSRPGRKGASHAITILRPGQRLIELVMSFRLPGISARQGPPPGGGDPDEAFAARRSVRAVPRVDHVTHLGGISLLDWQKNPCERAVKLAGTEYVDLTCRGLTLFPPDCAS